MLKNINNDKSGGDSFAGGRKVRKQFEEGSVTLEPGDDKRLPLGVYDSSAPTPEFDFTFEPHTEDDMIGAHLDKGDMPNSAEYMLTYMFHNYGQKSCVVTVRLRTDEAAGAEG